MSRKRVKNLLFDHISSSKRNLKKNCNSSPNDLRAISLVVCFLLRVVLLLKNKINFRCATCHFSLETLPLTRTSIHNYVHYNRAYMYIPYNTHLRNFLLDKKRDSSSPGPLFNTNQIDARVNTVAKDRKTSLYAKGKRLNVEL